MRRVSYRVRFVGGTLSGLEHVLGFNVPDEAHAARCVASLEADAAAGRQADTAGHGSPYEIVPGTVEHAPV